MKLFGFGRLAIVVFSFALLASAVFAQDYRGRVEGTVADDSGAIVPGAKVVLHNDGTKVEVTATTNADGRYVFDFVEPGNYSVIVEKEGFKKTIQQNLVVRIQGDLVVDVKLTVGDVAAVVTVEDTPVSVQFNSAGTALTLDNQTVDQMPVRGRNPYNIITLDPSINGGENNNGENRPYHHAYANELDAGGGTTRANEVQLNGTALTSSYKVAYTPSIDAVQEVTFSRSIVDSEQGFSSGGTIALNMKSGTEKFKGAAYFYKRDPRFNAVGDPTIPRLPTTDLTALKGTSLTIWGGNVGGPIIKKKVFFFSSFEKWKDARPISVRITVPTALERAGDFSQSGRNVYNPYTSTSNSSIRTQFTGNVIPSAMFDPVAVKLLQQIPLPNLAGNDLNWQGSKTENVKYWNASTRVDWNVNDKLKTYFSYGQFRANLLEANPTDSLMFPRTGSNRYGLSLAWDTVYTLNSTNVINFRAGYHRLTDEAAVPDALLGTDGLQNLWGSNTFYSSLFTTDQIYYPALDVLYNGGAANRLGRTGREFWQHPEGYNAALKVNSIWRDQSIKYGAEYRVDKGKGARFEPLNFYFRQNLTAIRQSASSSELLTSGSPWASFLLGVLEPNGTSTSSNNFVRRVPIQEVVNKGYALYVQDDWKITNYLTLNLGMRWEFEPGPVDAQNRLSQRLDLTQPIPEMVATPPVMPTAVQNILNQQGWTPTYNGAWIFANSENRAAWDRKPEWLPRFGFALKIDKKSSLRVGWARYSQPSARIRDPLGDFVEQYTGYSTTTFVSAVSNGQPLATLSNPYPSTAGPTFNPVLLPTEQTLGRYTNIGNAVNLDQYYQKAPLNDKYTVSFQREVWNKMIFSFDWFYNYGNRLPVTIDINAWNPHYTYNTPRSVWNVSVTNPFRNYLTPQTFPGALRNASTVAITQLLRPFPQYQAINMINSDLRKSKVQSYKFQLQQPYYKGLTFTVAYAYNDEWTTEAFDDIALYDRDFSWRRTDAAKHRFTNTISWEIPLGRGRKFFTNAPKALDYIIGGWRLTDLTRYYSGRLLQFTGSMIVNGDPRIAGSEQTKDRWFDTSVFSAVPDPGYLVRRTNPYYFEGLTGPYTFQTDATLSKSFAIRESMKLEFRLEVYNVTNHVNWDNPILTFGNVNFGKVIAKRSAYTGREVQYGFRFVF